MKYEDKVAVLNTINPDYDAQKLYGYEKALIGHTIDPVGNCSRAVYDYDKCIDILVKRDKMTQFQAIEFFDYNTLNSLVNTNDTTLPIIIKKF